MIRGGHVDVAVMGGLEVDEMGNLANWAVPGKPLLGVEGMALKKLMPGFSKEDIAASTEAAYSDDC